MTADIVILAIQTGIKLGKVAQEAYILKVKQGPLTLPLPDTGKSKMTFRLVRVES